MFNALLLLVSLTPPSGVAVSDNPNDEGSAILVSWSAGEEAGAEPVLYQVQRSTLPDSGFSTVNGEPLAGTEFLDNGVHDGTDYFYRVLAVAGADSALSAVAGPARSKAQWFNTARANILVLAILISAVFIIFIARARRGAKMFVRKIAGLDAIDDALGRATEMGKPILFSFGLGYITDIVVIAALPLLRKVAMKSAEYATPLIVPNSDPIVMTVAQETVKEAYSASGRPDFYNADNITFLTSDQFGYAAGVDGIIMREKPGAIFWLGYFYAESLIMAETGHSVGAIQLAGTTETTQLPFFVAACDYTMIGEEIYAASVYLRPEPVMLGSLKGEDLIKLALIIIISATVVLATTAALLGERAGFIGTVVETIARWFTPAY
jgi:hypothetical protein